MDNMEIWNKLKIPPPTALKKIEGGRLKGKTDINPQWRYEAITEVFGVCGIGWKYTIDKLWTEQGSQEQVLCFALISFYHQTGGEWSKAIPGIGGSMLVEKESGGLHSSDEGYKMAVTDALSVALKMIGVGAEVYRGIMESSKYGKPPLKEPQAQKTEQEYPQGELKIKDVRMQTGEKKDGSKWEKFAIIDNNDIKHTTFSRTFAEIAKQAKQKELPVKIEDEDGKFGKELVNIEIVQPLESAEPDDSPDDILTPEKCHIFAKDYKEEINVLTTVQSLSKWWDTKETLIDIKEIEPEAYTSIKTAYDIRMAEIKERLE